MNRATRRRIEAIRRHLADHDIFVASDHASLVRIVAALAEADPTVAGATVITPDGKVSYVDATHMRRGGAA